MTERPILCCGPMVRAIIEDRKNQTRRAFSPYILKLMKVAIQCGEVHDFLGNGALGFGDLEYLTGFCPYGQVGDRLWVRETWWLAEKYSYGTTAGGSDIAGPELAYRKGDPVFYAADGNPPNTPNRCYGPEGLRNGAFAAPDPFAVWIKRPSIHMPRWASRLLLEIVEVRVERVQQISETDARDEGMTLIDGNPRRSDGLDYSSEYASLWDRLNFKRGFGWSVNPWVWVIVFKKVEVTKP